MITFMNLIPTKSKAKLPKDLSYPVGAELLSEALKDIDQYKSLTVDFFDQPFIRKSQFQEQIDNNGCIPILWACYDGSDYCCEDGQYHKTWDITVFPVPRDTKNVVKEKIIHEGFPILISWYSKKTPPSFRGQKSCSLGFDLKTSSLLSEFK